MLAAGHNRVPRRRLLSAPPAVAALALAAALLAAAVAPAAASEPAPPRVDAKAWILVDPRDDTVLAAHAAQRRLPIASATKLMTAHLALERLRPKQKLTAVPYQALPAESILGLRPGERMTVRDLLYALLLASANDAAATIAAGVSGSTGAFVAEMNRAALALGLTRTHFANPIGLDAPGNYSTAADLVALADDLLAEPLFARIVDTPSTVLRSGNTPRRVDSRNLLLLTRPFISGVKTGHTLGAGYVLVGAGTRAGTTLLSAVLGAPSEAARDEETLKLLRYGFSLYRTRVIVERGATIADPELDYRSDRLNLVAKRTLELSTRGDQRVDTRVEAPEQVSGAVRKGEQLGRIAVSVDGHPAGAVPLVAAESVQAANLAQKAVATARKPQILVPAGAFVIVVGMLLAGRGRRPDARAPADPRRLGRRTRARERTAEERRRMHEQRLRRRARREGDRGGER